jgi:hypothetical protein
LDYDDKQSIGTVGDDYNQKINSLKTIWDISDHSRYIIETRILSLIGLILFSRQLEQTINTMVAMQQHHQQQDNNVQPNNSTKTDSYIPESNSTSSVNIPGGNTNVSSTTNDDTNNKNTPSNGNLQSTGSSSTINQPTIYSTTTGSNKNEQKNICTVSICF